MRSSLLWSRFRNAVQPGAHAGPLDGNYIERYVMLTKKPANGSAAAIERSGALATQYHVMRQSREGLALGVLQLLHAAPLGVLLRLHAAPPARLVQRAPALALPSATPKESAAPPPCPRQVTRPAALSPAHSHFACGAPGAEDLGNATLRVDSGVRLSCSVFGMPDPALALHKRRSEIKATAREKPKNHKHL